MIRQSETRAAARRKFLLATGVLSILALAAEARAQAAPNPPAAAPDTLEIVATAVHVAPSAAPLDVVQPTSNIQQEFIQNNIIPLASFDDIVKFAPSVFDQSPNGPGLGKSEILTIRGFQDGQFNVTFDGIPFGDATNFQHTSSALWIAHDIGEAQVDRGPGTAMTVGDATFGGQMDFDTKQPLARFTINPYATIGSFGTYAGGVEIDSGRDSPIGDAFFDIQRETSNGYLTYATEQRTNLMFKDIYKVSDALTLTAEASYNHAFEYTTQGATLANIQAFGPNFGLNDNPDTQAYYGYQPSNYYSDFDYVDLDYKFAPGWRLDNKAYTVQFGHDYTESSDPTQTSAADDGVTYYGPTGAKLSPQPAGAATDVPGKLTQANWRAFGDLLRFTGDLPFGDLLFGVWVDRNSDYRWSVNTDLTKGNIPVDGKYGTPYTYDINDTLTTIEPYVEFDWKVTPDLTVTPGVRFSDFQRGIDALYNKVKPPAPADFSETFTQAQPSISARYTIQPGWTAYAQAASGFLAPPINVLEVTTGPASVRPESTWNYQAGANFKAGRWILGADVYYIDFSNYITSVTVGGVATYSNGGGAVYDGVEFEGQYVLDHGFSLYGNATYNSAKYKGTDVWLAEAPEATAAAGVLYDNRHGPYASFIAKWVGSRYGLDTPLSGAAGHLDQFGLDPFVTADFAAGWRFREPFQHVQDVTVSLKVSNVFNNTAIDDYAGQQSAASTAFPYGAPLYWTVAGRSAFVNLSASF